MSFIFSYIEIFFYSFPLGILTIYEKKYIFYEIFFYFWRKKYTINL